MQLTCYPPLAGTTVVDGNKVDVVVCMDLAPDEVAEWTKPGDLEPTCSLWHYDCGGDFWVEAPMHMEPVDVFLTVPGNESNKAPYEITPTYIFKTTLKAQPWYDRPIAYTFKYTVPSNPNTTLWANHELQTCDGMVLFRPALDPDDILEDDEDEKAILHSFFTLPPAQNVTLSRMRRTTDTTIASSPPATWVYNIKLAERRHSDYSTPGYTEAILGAPVSDRIVSHFATVKHSTAWVEPSHSRNRGQGWEGFRPPRECVLAAFLTVRGVIVFLPISTAQSTLYLKGDGQGRVVAVGRNDTTQVVEGRVVVVAAGDIEEAVDEAFYWAKRISGVSEAEAGQSAADGEDPWSNSLKYCTWNSLGRDLTERRVTDAVSDLYDAKIKVETIIIDDNWQSLDNNGRGDQFAKRWLEFEADKKAFPRGLKGLVDDIKRKHTGVKHVAVWHGILGYWNGISPDGWIARNYKVQDMGNGIHVVSASDVGRFYHDFYQYCLIDERIPSAEKAEIFPAYLAAWRAAAHKWFGTRAISCMSLVPQILFTNHLSPSLPRFTLRNSDDFFPHTPDSHPWHIFANAHNALFTSRLNVLADWDMFQTRHDWAGYHAAARCISGGPVYITDDVGRHDASIVRKITATGKDGQMLTLRPGAGKSFEYFNNYTESKIVKTISIAGTDDYKIKVVGTFSLDGGRARSDMFSLKQVVGPKVTSNSKYAVYSHSSGAARLVGAESYAMTTLEKGGWDVLSVSPIWTARTRGDNEVRLAVFGLLEQISGAAALTNVRFRSDGSTVKISVGLKALGVVGIFASYTDPKLYGRIRQVTIGGVDVPEKYIYVGEREDYGTIKIYVEDAWNALTLDDRWDLDLWIHMAA
ncbi:Alpha-galactosidase [Orbilia brochopaga]|nr:Alpha-galactosidase [Drechslerella brochopaga]